jgi:predicted nucleotide-binding protein
MPKKTDHGRQDPAKLIVARSIAQEKIEAQIDKGSKLKAIEITSSEAVEETRKQYYRWDEYNIELLGRIFTNDSLATEYRGYSVGGSFSDRPLQRQIKELRDDVEYKIGNLQSILARLELIPEQTQVSNAQHFQALRSSLPGPARKKVFIVHGHDEGAKQSVARFLEKLRVEAIILHELPNVGRTIIEKFESHSDDVGFAVVLLTPDDKGGSADSNTLVPRARQNVILELGYFMGKLGRNRVCALYRDQVEIPSDYVGVAYIALDPAGAWQLQLAKELKHADIDVDLNRAI